MKISWRICSALFSINFCISRASRICSALFAAFSPLQSRRSTNRALQIPRNLKRSKFLNIAHTCSANPTKKGKSYKIPAFFINIILSSYIYKLIALLHFLGNGHKQCSSTDQLADRDLLLRCMNMLITNSQIDRWNT